MACGLLRRSRDRSRADAAGRARRGAGDDARAACPQLRRLALHRLGRQHDVAEELRVVRADRDGGAGRERQHVGRRVLAAIAAVEPATCASSDSAMHASAAADDRARAAHAPSPPLAQAPRRRRPLPSRRRPARHRCRDVAEARRSRHRRRRRRRPAVAFVTGVSVGHSTRATSCRCRRLRRCGPRDRGARRRRR